MKKVIEKFEVKYMQILDENGNYDEKILTHLPDSEIKKMYDLMILARTFDDKAFNLQRQGRLNTFAQLKGQEATQIGLSFALQKNDWFFPMYRDNGAMIAMGLPIHSLLQYWSGDERGLKIPEGINVFPPAIPVGTQILHAVGTAWAMKIQKHNSATMVCFGEGATSTGDFHEAMNWAGAFKLPVVFICENNQWAISLPVKEQTSSETIAQKAIAYGFSGIQVDGNDVFAVYKAVKDAIENAHNAGGPTMIECLTYRIADHTTADASVKYRDPKEVEEWVRKDPIDRLEKYMSAKGLLNEDYKKSVAAKASDTLEDAVRKMEAIPAPEPDSIFEHVYEKSGHLKEQIEKFKQTQ